ncbi:hypothetical protein IQE94_10455 [Synechocystis sp. PCC 7339]|uniref:hypothetical protein n=1 Tax=unclassified Synechocystis TaxID=2640012 RepID=UPI001BF00FCE|nr:MULTISPECIES: hypothetical protein [unclassified Synechocystis]QUS59393.1 hypothetical protein HTZ78_00955 [Synechocystis sp. PCC 7338]UAJ71576.1 hypothetical protein IQE94_10455 [Synechocystis sp. PCC 7339]
MELITQKQLVELGLTKYQAKQVIRKLNPVTKIKRANTYGVQEVIFSINEYLNKKKIKETTRVSLERVKSVLMPTLENLVQGEFGADSISEIGKLAQIIMAKSSQVNRKIAKLERRSQEIKGRYEKK